MTLKEEIIELLDDLPEEQALRVLDFTRRLHENGSMARLNGAVSDHNAREATQPLYKTATRKEFLAALDRLSEDSPDNPPLPAEAFSRENMYD